jgi:ABC-type glutathione transport system ATPase component
VRRPRLGELAHVSQDPLSACDPRFTVEQIVAEGLGAWRWRSRRRHRERIVAVLEEVGLSASHLHRRAAQLSGGQQQRLVVARALAARPRLLVCDEGTSALDGQARGLVLDAIERLCRQHGTALVCVTHDPAVLARLCRRVLVMRDGRVVEERDPADGSEDTTAGLPGRAGDGTAVIER